MICLYQSERYCLKLSDWLPIVGNTLAEQDPGHQRQHLPDEGRRHQAHSLRQGRSQHNQVWKPGSGSAALIIGQGASGGAGVAAGP